MRFTVQQQIHIQHNFGSRREPKGAGSLGKTTGNYESGGLCRAGKDERIERMLEPNRGQESERAKEDIEDGSASPFFIRPLILLLLLHLRAQPVLGALFPTHPLHQTII